MMGQASLQVFCAHLLFCFMGLAIMGYAPVMNGWHETALLTITLLGMLLTAQGFSRDRLKTSGNGAAASRPVPQFGD
jgi:hypothetical protein